ncbi:MAG: nucleoside hydrolase [Promethearchaeota archaeon]
MPVPVILDTDIGTDIDDTWALAFLLNCPEIDLKLVTVATGDTTYRARIAAKMLEVAGRSDVPVGVGNPQHGDWGPQAPWVAEYDLGSYPGSVTWDAAAAIVDVVANSPEPVTVVGIGPLPNVASALDIDPGVTDNARFVGMHGSIRRGYGGSLGAVPEYNVVKDVAACGKVFAAPWGVTITPLDTCGVVKLGGERFRRLKDADSPLAVALLENYEAWAWRVWGDASRAGVESSVLFDTVAVFLAFSERWLVIEDLPLRVTDEGLTQVHEGSRVVRCATGWGDRESFEDFLVTRLLGGA